MEGNFILCKNDRPSGLQTTHMPKTSESIMEKLKILSDAAKYDVSCSSSGVGRRGDGTGIGNTLAAGICHSFSAFMTVNIALTENQMMCPELLLLRMKYVN